jgi:hypothetical protein
MAQLNAHAKQLYDDLGSLAESGEAEIGQPLANVYNALLEQAQKISSDDRLIGVLTPVGDGLHPRVVQALAGQLKLVLGGS